MIVDSVVSDSDFGSVVLNPLGEALQTLGDVVVAEGGLGGWDLAAVH